MAIINETYFFGAFNIGQKSSPAVKQNIIEAIDTYEPQYLDEALGEDFAALFNAEIEDERFEVLENMFKEGQSPIAGYVFFHYQRENSLQATGSGDVIPKAENAKVSINGYRMRVAWNIMVRNTRKIQKFLIDNCDTYPEFDICLTNSDVVINLNDFEL